MIDLGYWGIFLFIFGCLITVACAFVFRGRFKSVSALPRNLVFMDASRIYEFHDGHLVSALDPFDAFLGVDTTPAHAFAVLSYTLATLHPDLKSSLNRLKSRGESFLLTGRLGADALDIAGRKDAESGRLIITMAPAIIGHNREFVDRAALAALKREVTTSRSMLDSIPIPMWCTDTKGRLTWANAPYFDLVEAVIGKAQTLSWPLPQVFEIDTHDGIEEHAQRVRVQLSNTNDGVWYDVTAKKHDDDTTLWAAVGIDRLIVAEKALENFVQTLSVTFAHLPIGLAVFDRRRILIHFNPALVTHSTLETRFLANRPSLTAFLDALRAQQRMPEPKDYRAWRDEIARLERGAEEGSYHELWTLPSGQCFRVTGRPHPDGAVAFMFEDISAEVSLTRQFRADLNMFQAVLDDTPEAVGVFASDGRLAICNSGYVALWGDDCGDDMTRPSMSEVIKSWHSKAPQTPLWSDIKQFFGQTGQRKSWQSAVALLDGRVLRCQVSPLPGSATMVRFIILDTPQDRPIPEQK